MTITYEVKRNTRFVSEKGRYNCEAFEGKHYLCDAPGDTAREARAACERRVAQIVKARGA